MLPAGRARFHDGLPLLRDLNALLVEGDAPDDLPGVAARIQAGRPQLHVELHGAPPPSLPAGWEVEQIVHLQFHGSAPARPAQVEDTDRAALAALREEWVRDEIPALADVILEGDDRIFAVNPTRAFAVRDRGRPVAMALLVGDGPVRMVEDVYATPSHRGRGLGAAVTRAAVATALAEGAEVVHLPADPHGLARVLYERLGFRAAAVTTRLTLELAQGRP